jgi:hypothetical protein
MTKLRDAISVRCPVRCAPGYLTAYFDRQADDQGAGVTLMLHLPIVDVTVDREVVATLTAPAGEWPKNRFDFSWGPKSSGAYPVFNGHLDIEDDGPARCRLVLSGSYRPPYGFAGKAFDAALGRRIAVATVRELLDTLRNELEAAYHVEFERENAAGRGAVAGHAHNDAAPAPIDPERILDALYKMPAAELD